MVRSSKPEIQLGQNARKIIDRDHRALVKSTKVSPIVARDAKGIYVTDVDGNRYIDLTAGIAVMNVGHCHPGIVNAIKSQAEKLLHFAGQDYYYEEQVAIAEKLAEITPGNFPKQVFLSNSGTEANECAFKLVRWHKNRPGMIAFLGAFHGRTFGSLSLSSAKPVHTRRFQPLLGAIYKTPYAYCYRCFAKLQYPDCDLWCARYIDEVLLRELVAPDQIAAMIMEPIQGEHGYIVPPDDFLRILRKICDKHDILMIDDEVQTGFGRTGKMFAVEHAGIAPDIITLAKAIASGMPMGATVTRKEIANWDAGSHSNTTGGNPIACTVALANIEIIKKERLADNARKVGSEILKRLRELEKKSRFIGDVRGRGLMVGIEFVEDKQTKKPLAHEKIDKIMIEGVKRGLILLPAGFSTIRIAPPLVISCEEAERAMELFVETVLAVERA
jgi:4-aminobutyrate aminotransferase